ncbi:MAG: hypothetical protein AB1679_21585 [Actinomycetota bacterium]
MADIRVDPAALEELARRLAGLKVEFEGLGDLMEDYERSAGSREIARKLEDFADNWSDQRAKVAEQLQKLAAMAAGASCFYREREAALAAELNQAAGPTGQG